MKLKKLNLLISAHNVGRWTYKWFQWPCARAKMIKDFTRWNLRMWPLTVLMAALTGFPYKRMYRRFVF